MLRISWWYWARLGLLLWPWGDTWCRFERNVISRLTFSNCFGFEGVRRTTLQAICCLVWRFRANKIYLNEYADIQYLIWGDTFACPPSPIKRRWIWNVFSRLLRLTSVPMILSTFTMHTLNCRRYILPAWRKSRQSPWLRRTASSLSKRRLLKYVPFEEPRSRQNISGLDVLGGAMTE